MKTFVAVALFAFSMLVCGCDARLDERGTGNSSGLPRKNPAVLPWPPGEGPMADAQHEFVAANSLEASGRHSDALLLYKRIASLSPQFGDEAGLGAARCLLAMDKPAPALAALEPLNIPAQNRLDHEKLALAGQALLMQRKFRAAEAALTHALGGVGEEHTDTPWAPAAYANFGKALLENDKAEEASAAYRVAARLYAAVGRRDRAATCRDMQVTIDEWLEERNRRGY
jgi:tetratricopeptide (TPR) repeat protein